MDDDGEEAAREASLRRAQAEPMPAGLRGQVEDLIEPHTIGMEIKHGDVMRCIRVAWPVIRDWLRGHPADLGGAARPVDAARLAGVVDELLTRGVIPGAPALPGDVLDAEDRRAAIEGWLAGG